jgi:hypothetical protein
VSARLRQSSRGAGLEGDVTSKEDKLLVGSLERELVEDLTHRVLERTAPEELLVFDEIAPEYFEDPVRVLEPRRREEAVGFGLDLALWTPYVLATVTPVVQFLVAAFTDALRDDARHVAIRLLRRLCRREDQEPGEDGCEGSALTTEQGRRIHDIALARARSLGLTDEQAELLATSVVGSLVVAT